MDFDLGRVDRASAVELADALRSSHLNDAFACPHCRSPKAELTYDGWTCRACDYRGTHYGLCEAVKCSPEALSRFFGERYVAEHTEQARPHTAAWLSVKAQRDRVYREQVFTDDLRDSIDDNIITLDKIHAYERKYGRLALGRALSAMARLGMSVAADLGAEYDL